jgi:hypothetical protein
MTRRSRLPSQIRDIRPPVIRPRARKYRVAGSDISYGQKIGSVGRGRSRRCARSSPSWGSSSSHATRRHPMSGCSLGLNALGLIPTAPAGAGGSHPEPLERRAAVAHSPLTRCSWIASAAPRSASLAPAGSCKFGAGAVLQGSGEIVLQGNGPRLPLRGADRLHQSDRGVVVQRWRRRGRCHSVWRSSGSAGIWRDCSARERARGV